MTSPGAGGAAATSSNDRSQATSLAMSDHFRLRRGFAIHKVPLYCGDFISSCLSEVIDASETTVRTAERPSPVKKEERVGTVAAGLRRTACMGLVHCSLARGGERCSCNRGAIAGTQMARAQHAPSSCPDDAVRSCLGLERCSKVKGGTRCSCHRGEEASSWRESERKLGTALVQEVCANGIEDDLVVFSFKSAAEAGLLPTRTGIFEGNIRSVFDTRDGFLRLCREQHYQFDQLRRAKHSTMMLLEHVHSSLERVRKVNTVQAAASTVGAAKGRCVKGGRGRGRREVSMSITRTTTSTTAAALSYATMAASFLPWSPSSSRAPLSSSPRSHRSPRSSLATEASSPPSSSSESSSSSPSPAPPSKSSSSSSDRGAGRGAGRGASNGRQTNRRVPLTTKTPTMVNSSSKLKLTGRSTKTSSNARRSQPAPGRSTKNSSKAKRSPPVGKKRKIFNKGGGGGGGGGRGGGGKDGGCKKSGTTYAKGTTWARGSKAKAVEARRFGSTDEDDWVQYASQSEAGRECGGINVGSVSQVVCGKQEVAGGYEFRHAKQDAGGGSSKRQRRK